MSFRRSYDDIRDSIISQITKGVVDERHSFTTNRTRYRLNSPGAQKLYKVDGTTGGQSTTFREEVDYRLVGDRVEWLPGGAWPDADTVFTVNYSTGENRPLTDANPGSVIRTIVEAVSREMDYMYAQMKHVYDAGFIDTASGSSLDLVASLLGVTRKPAEPATGKVTFGRNTPPPEVTVEREPHLTTGRDRYPLNAQPVKQVSKIEGSHEGAPKEFTPEVDYTLREGAARWLDDGVKPDLNTTFYVDYVTYEKITVPAATPVSNYARRAEDAKAFETLSEETLEPTAEGKWEADIKVKSSIPGSGGNVFAGSLTVMPQPPMGVEYVINRGDILTGVDVEPDAELRKRTKAALEVAGKASVVSLESAINGVEGVSSVLIEDMPEGVPGIVKVIVQGGDRGELLAVIDDTRAAGVRVEFSRPSIVNIDLDVTVTYMPGVRPAAVSGLVESRIRSYISSLNIGDDVVYNRIINSSLQVDGVYDVSDLNLGAVREGEEITESTGDNITISPVEMALPREVNILLREKDRRAS